MRHFAALSAAILIAPLTWLLLAFGQDRPDQMTSGAVDVTGVDRTLACLLGAGLLVGLVATLRLSRLGVALTGVAYAAVHLSALVFPEAVLGLFPAGVSVAGRSVDPTLPLRTGTALVFAVVMLAAMAGLGRRRPRHERAKEPEPGTGRSVRRPTTAAATPGVASHRTASSQRPDNRRWSSFGPAHNGSGDRLRQNRQFTWPYQ
jgi:hypothetical protein